MDDAACTDRLAELLNSSDPTLRYGAFIALRLADESNAAVRGLMVNNSYWLHRVAPGSAGMVHMTSDRRCEIVVFGDNVKFRPFTLPIASEYTVRVPSDGGDATVTRIVKVKGDLEERKLTCAPDVAAVLVTLGQLGGGYGEAVELIRRADRAQVLTGPVVIDAIPSELNIRQLARFAGRDDSLIKADAEIARLGVVRPALDADGFNLPASEPDPATQYTPPPPARRSTASRAGSSAPSATTYRPSTPAVDSGRRAVSIGVRVQCSGSEAELSF